jgi:hypothetical protein
MRVALLSVMTLAAWAARLAAQDSTAAAKAPPATAAQPAPAPAQAGGTAGQHSLSSSLGLYAFPAKGQTPEQQKQDENTCYTWAQEQSGIDPAKVSVNTDSAKQAGAARADSATAGAGIKGGAAGAAGGAVIGGIAGDAGTGAAIGAVAGVAKGRKAKKEAKKQSEQQAAQQAQAQAAGTIDSFKKAFSACLEGKGYTIK